MTASPRPPRGSRPLARASLPATLLAAALSAASLPAPSLLPAQELSPRAAADSLLALSQAADVLGGQATAFANQVRRTAPGLSEADWARLAPVLEAELAYEPLYEDLAAYLVEEAPEGRLARALEVLTTGSAGALTRQVAARPPSRSMEEFLEEMEASPPDPARLRVMVQWAEAQSAGDFYVVVSEALRRAVHEVVGEMTPVPAYEPMDEPRYLALRQRSFEGAVGSFLYRFQDVPDEVIRRATEEYRSEAAAWYVEAYTLGIAEAVLAAGERIRAAVEEGAGGGPAPG